jgi:uncharacterized cupredoxin-like copper-binding protein
MNARRIAGITAMIAGLLLVFAIAGSAMSGATGVLGNDPTTSWQMGPGMMAGGPGMMGSGVMDHGNVGPAATAVPGATEIRVQAANFSFTPNEIRLPKGIDVNLTLVNPAGTGAVHDFTVPALAIHVAASPGEARTVGLRGLAAGRYEAYCSVPGHADLGMRATVVVD